LLKKRVKAILVNFALMYLVFGVAVTPVTVCYFSDLETSKNNEFTAGSLDFSLRDEDGNEVDKDLIEEDLNPGDFTGNKIIIKDNGTTPFKYSISMDKTGGSDNVCSALNVKLERDGVEVYDNKLSDLDDLTLNLSGSQDEVNFKIYLDGNGSSLQDKSCEFDLDFIAKQKIPSGGFSDREKITSNEIKTDWWIKPDVEVLSPNGGEELLAGSSYDITWEAISTDSSDTAFMKIDIYFSMDGGDNFTLLEDDTENDGVFGWVLNEDYVSDTLKIKIEAEDKHGLTGSDKSDDLFSIVLPEPPIE